MSTVVASEGFTAVCLSVSSDDIAKTDAAMIAKLVPRRVMKIRLFWGQKVKITKSLSFFRQNAILPLRT